MEFFHRDAFKSCRGSAFTSESQPEVGLARAHEHIPSLRAGHGDHGHHRHLGEHRGHEVHLGRRSSTVVLLQSSPKASMSGSCRW